MSKSLEVRSSDDKTDLVLPKELNKCSFRYSVEEKLAKDSNYEFYGVMKTHCAHCDGHQYKCNGYLKKTIV